VVIIIIHRLQDFISILKSIPSLLHELLVFAEMSLLSSNNRRVFPLDINTKI